MSRRLDRFEQRLLAYRKEHGMTVPDALSPQCETRMHPACSGGAWDKLKDEPASCSCSCHRHPVTRRSR